MGYPYYQPPVQVEGVVTNAAGNAARDTSTYSTETTNIRDVSNEIHILDSTITPFTSVLTSVGKNMEGGVWKSGHSLQKAGSGSYKFEEIEDRMAGRYCKVAAPGYAASGAVTVTVTGAGTSSAYIFTPGDVVVNWQTGERMLVATVASSTTITVASGGRAFGTTAAAAGLAGQGLFILGSANEENGLARNVNNTLKTVGYNYCQIFKETMAASGSAASTVTYGGPDAEYQRRKHGIELNRKIEASFLWGERMTTTGTQGKRVSATGGVREGIVNSQALVHDQQFQLLTAPDLNVFLGEAFTNGANKKTIMAGNKIVAAVTEIARGQLITKMGDATYGLAINQWVTPFGSVDIVFNPLFTSEVSGEGLVLDFDCFRYRFLNGNGVSRDITLQMNVQAPDMDGKIDQFIGEVGLERVTIEKCALMKNVA